MESIVRCHFPGSTRQYDYKTLYTGALNPGDRALVINNNGVAAVVHVDEASVPEKEDINYAWLIHPLEEIIHDELADIEAWQREKAGEDIPANN